MRLTASTPTVLTIIAFAVALTVAVLTGAWWAAFGGGMVAWAVIIASSA
jgi:hypothetical protein